jgi:succinyldiaminopimelate transaminase
VTAPSDGFRPPPYPYERLDELEPLAAAHDGGLIDLSIGTPCDPPADAVRRALADSDSERGYPPSVGSPAFREAASGWMARRLGVQVDAAHVGACVGTKEFVGTLPQWLRLRVPARDIVLFPAVAYPTYEMGARLAGCRPVAVPVDDRWRMRLDLIAPTDAERALCLWVNSPGNPTGALADLAAAAAWGQAHGVPVFSDECYVEYTWDGPRRTILEHGLDGLVAVHSLSKRSNLAGARAGFYAGDPELVGYLTEVRKHVGMMVPGPVQAAAAVALADDGHVEVQRTRYRERIDLMVGVLDAIGVKAQAPEGTFYLWVDAPDGDAWAFTERLARDGGALVAPGDLYGVAGAGHVRIALVQPTERIELVGRRLTGRGLTSSS